MVGFAPIPFQLIAELFPLQIRGIGYSIGISQNCFIQFLALQYYFNLVEYFGGVIGVQYFFAVVGAAAFVYTYIFVPETFQVKMSDISKYFETHNMYIGHRKNTNQV